MPLYSLLCEGCDIIVEQIRKVDEVVKCRKCGKAMKRLPAQTTFKLIGDGWAKDGYSARRGV